jgi:predicted nucleic acid-binding protein
MKIVVDTNIIFSSLVRRNSFLGDALLDKEADFVMPKYAYIELFKYKEKIIQASQHSEDEILEILYKLLRNVDIIDENMITAGTLKEAFQLVKDVDEKDLIFVALTIELDGLLWTMDKKLIKGVQKKGFSKICKLQDRKLVQINTNDTLK